MTALPSRMCLVCGATTGPTFAPGPGGRPDAACPSCGSLERHRFLTVLLASLRSSLGPVDVLLDIAPTPHVTPLLAALEPRRHLRLDLGADNRLVDVLGSVTDLPLADDSVDLLLCYHVLEHVPDDARAMTELARVLRPGGVGLIQVPWKPDVPTDEDPSAPVEVRLARFGQADHVRYYGSDFEDRLVAAGLSLQRVTPRSLLGDVACELFKISPHEMVWIATVGAGTPVARPAVEPPTGLTLALDFLVGQAVGQQAKADDATRRLRKVQRRLGELERAVGPLLKVARKLPPPMRARLRRLSARASR